MLDFYGVTMRSRELVDDYDEAVEALAILGHKGRKGRKALKRYEETREALFEHLRKLEAK